MYLRGKKHILPFFQKLFEEEGGIGKVKDIYCELDKYSCLNIYITVERYYHKELIWKHISVFFSQYLDENDINLLDKSPNKWLGYFLDSINLCEWTWDLEINDKRFLKEGVNNEEEK